MATKLFDLTENNQGGAFSGWVSQTTTGASVVGDSTVLITGLKTTKHTVVDSLGTVDRADVSYDRSSISPAGVTGFGLGASRWFRFATKLDANYVPQVLGGNNDGRFNIIFDIHGNIGGYTPWGLGINAVSGKWYINAQGGGSNLSSPTTVHNFDLFTYVVGDVVDWKCYVLLNQDSTGRSVIKASINGGAYTTYDDYTGPIGSTAETGFYPKLAHYRAGNKAGGTTTVYHSGMIVGDTEADLVVPAAGTNKIGYLSAGTPVVGATVNANGIGKRGSGPWTMPQDGTITHLADYIDYTGSGNIQAIMVLYADSGGAPGAKLGQTRIYTPNAATDGSGFKELQLCQSVSRTSGQSVWIITYFGTNAALTRWRGDSVGTNTFFSDSNSWTVPEGPSDPAGTNATANPNRTKSGYLLYVTPQLDATPPASSCSFAGSSTSPAWTISFAASDDINLDKVDLYAKTPVQSSYFLVQTDNAAGGTSYNGSFVYTPSAGVGSYRFYTVATDAAGNAELVPANPDVTVTISGSTALATFVSATAQTIYTVQDPDGMTRIYVFPAGGSYTATSVDEEEILDELAVEYGLNRAGYGLAGYGVARYGTDAR